VSGNGSCCAGFSNIGIANVAAGSTPMFEKPAQKRPLRDADDQWWCALRANKLIPDQRKKLAVQQVCSHFVSW
jgi:hypothetical protein